jgi:hypothetical protein
MKLLVKLFTKTVTKIDIWLGGNRLEIYMGQANQDQKEF